MTNSNTSPSIIKNFEDINNETLKSMLQEASKYQFVDVRTEGEYNLKHIKGFDVFIDYYIFRENPSLIHKYNLDKNKPVIIICRSGVRSIDASNIFYNEGFTEVYNLKQGIIMWNGETE